MAKRQHPNKTSHTSTYATKQINLLQGDSMKEYTYDILIENNFSMFPELCSHPMVVDSVYNRHNDYYIDKKEKKKHLFNMCIVLNGMNLELLITVLLRKTMKI